MSRAFTVGPRTQTNTAGRGARVNTTTKKPSTSTRTGGNGARNSSSHRSGGTALADENYSSKVKSSAPSINQNKSPVARTSVTTVSKPRVVTLADLNSGGNNKKSNTSNQRTASTKQPTPVKNCKGTGTKKTGRSMWDQELNPPNNHKTTSIQRGSRNVIASTGNHGNGRQGIASSVNSPGSRLTSGDQEQAGDSERKATYQPQGAYTRISPDQKKRDKLQSQRSEELARLDDYKEKKKVAHVSIKPSRVGGSGKSVEESRRQQEREQKNKKYDQLRKRQQWADEKKKREEEEYAEKKAKAREQTEHNRWRDQERQRELQADRQAWIARGGLDKLEGGAGGQASETQYDGREDVVIDESVVEGLMEMFPFKSRQKLVEMLTAAKGDVNRVVDWLRD